MPSIHESPPRSVPEDDNGYFEKITQAVLQAGFSWQVIRQKWPNFKSAFANFDINSVAGFTDEDIERLLGDRGIVRNGRKISATVHNAQICQKLVGEHGSFLAFLRSMDDLNYTTRSKKICKQFKFIGPMGTYFFFWSVGEEVPPYEQWRAEQEY